ncbi:MAG: DUF805 domain-containing protein [Bacteroidota bacterium]
MNWYLKVMRQYADFSGRARRKEYWMFTLFNFIFALVAMGFDAMMGSAFIGGMYGITYMTYALATIVPGIAVAVRRMHDVGKSGWMLFIALIPLIGSIWLLILLFTDSQKGTNKWGPDPKATDDPYDMIDQFGEEAEGQRF